MKIHGTAKGGALSTKDFGVAFGGAPAGPTNLCNDALQTGTSLGAGSGYLRVTPIDVSSLSSPFTVTHLAYTAGDMNGSIAMGLYSDDSGSPDALICETGSHAIASNNTTYIATTTTPSTEHSNVLHIGFITKDITVPFTIKGESPVSPPESEYMTWDISNYPDLPDPFVATGGTGTNWFFCLTAGA